MWTRVHKKTGSILGLRFNLLKFIRVRPNRRLASRDAWHTNKDISLPYTNGHYESRDPQISHLVSLAKTDTKNLHEDEGWKGGGRRKGKPPLGSLQAP